DMRTKELSKILELSVAQRLMVMSQIWESIAESPDSIPLTAAQQQELDTRLNSYYENPKAGQPWEKVKEKLLSTL
ncbi:MAG TPA: addiction module protein, partial [Candidatus Kapabacteria bacterium]|nr:addiction module protein [Candidatus Kapabacteria bacterium]